MKRGGCDGLVGAAAGPSCRRKTNCLRQDLQPSPFSEFATRWRFLSSKMNIFILGVLNVSWPVGINPGRFCPFRKSTWRSVRRWRRRLSSPRPIRSRRWRTSATTSSPTTRRWRSAGRTPGSPSGPAARRTHPPSNLHPKSPGLFTRWFSSFVRDL